MRPPSPKPKEAAAAVACRGGLLAPARPSGSGSARARTTWGHGVGFGPAPSAAGRRLLIASPGVGEPLPAARSLGEGAVALEVHEHDHIASAEILQPDDAPARTVRVKFVLKKQCAFGQHFLVVGDDPALGLWDPARAAVSDWSEGHVWTVRTDLPANKSIEFKFLLRDASGHVRWQHGPNRTLQTTETSKFLVVHEDWDHAKNQKISEEEELLIDVEYENSSDDLARSYALAKKNLARSNGAMLSDELRTDERLQIDASPVAADASLHLEMMGVNEATQQQLTVEKDHKIPDYLGEKTSTVSRNGNPSADDNAGRGDDHDTTLPQEGALQLANRSTRIFENDLAWARKALQQLLRFLGFRIGTTRT